MIKNITVVPYNPDWPKLYQEEATIIKSALNTNLVSINHIGSTSIPGLYAKPTIDIIAEVLDPKQALEDLQTIGYTYKGEYNIPLRDFLSKTQVIDVHLHLCPKGSPEIELNLLFRDYLRTHPDELLEYANLKKTLTNSSTAGHRTNSMFTNYTTGKNQFITKILTAANLTNLRLRKCAHSEEYQAATNLANSSNPINFVQPNHAHLILYSGLNIIAYAHLEFHPLNHTATTHSLALDPSYKHLQPTFLNLINAWLTKLNFTH